MSSAVNDDDFDFNSDDDNWGDDEDFDIMDDSTKILQLSQINSIERENDNACWKCEKCDNINNVKLTIEKQDMRCCGCQETCYIPDETKTIQCSNWHTHNDYLLRIGTLKQIKVWICNKCTFKNKDINSQCCEICESKRNPKCLITTTTVNTNDTGNKENISSNTNNSNNKYSEDTYDYTSFNESLVCDDATYADGSFDDTVDNVDDMSEGEEWQCTQCTVTNTSKLKCNTCGCRKILKCKFSNSSLSELLSYGYIRRFANSLNIFNSNVQMPEVVCKLCERFRGNSISVDNDRFEKQMIFPQELMFTEISNLHPLKSKFLCETDSYIHNVFGEQVTNKYDIMSNEGYHRYRWRVKLKLNENICGQLDNTNEKKISGISIGISSDEFRLFGSSGNIFKDYQFAYGIHGIPRRFMDNDVITLDFDASEETFSYGINDDWFGIEDRNIQKDNLRLCISVKQKGVEIECLSIEML